MTKKYKSLFSLLCWYAPVLLVQLVSERVTVASINPWYKELIKASWTPPAWVFGPTWTLLYILMTVAVWLVYQTDTKPRQRNTAYALFFGQLALNALWSLLFFGLHSPAWALIDLSLLILLLAITIRHFYRIRPLAGFLLIPYLLWSVYALSLNAAIWWLNPF